MRGGGRTAPRWGSGISGVARRTAHYRVAALLLVAALVTPLRAGAAESRMLRQDSISVVYWQGHEGLARRTLEEATSPLSLPGIPAAHRMVSGTIYLAPSPEVLDSITGGRVPHWAAGVALPSQQIIVLPAYRRSGSAFDDPLVVLRHELAHLALNAYLPGPIPRWFDEGYATWISGGLDESAGWQIRFAFLLGRGPPLDSLALNWPRGANRSRLAYLLSASAVRHMATRGGDRAFEALLTAWREQGALDPALRSTYQMTLGQFEREWRAEVSRRYGWLLAISQIGAFWVFVTVVFLVFGSLRRKRDREKLERMRAEERLAPPDETRYWLGEVDGAGERMGYADGGDAGNGPPSDRYLRGWQVPMVGPPAKGAPEPLPGPPGSGDGAAAADVDPPERGNEDIRPGSGGKLPPRGGTEENGGPEEPSPPGRDPDRGS